MSNAYPVSSVSGQAKGINMYKNGSKEANEDAESEILSQSICSRQDYADMIGEVITKKNKPENIGRLNVHANGKLSWKKV